MNTTMGSVVNNGVYNNMTLNETRLKDLGLNSNLDFDERFSPEKVLVDQYVTPVIYAIGFPGNMLSFIVWIQKRMRHSSGCYLAALALDDLIFLCLHVMFELQTVWRVHALDAPGVCEIYPIFYIACQYLSPLLVLGFTVERYISICHPFKREKFCTTKRAKIVIACLTALSLSMSGIQGYIYTYNSNASDCGPREELVTAQPINFLIVWNMSIEMFVFLLVPLNVLFLNILVIRELRRLSRVETQQLHGRGQKTSATTVMLLAVSFYQIITTLPVTIVYALYFEFPSGSLEIPVSQVLQDPQWNRFFTYYLIQTIIKEYGTTHYAFNIFIYMITGKLFRKEVTKLLCMSKLCAFQFKVPVTEYSSLRSTARTSLRLPNLWVSVNGHVEKEKDETKV